MKRAHGAISLSITEIDTLIDILSVEARGLPAGTERDCVLETVLQLQMYADAKRWIESPGQRPQL